MLCLGLIILALVLAPDAASAAEALGRVRSAHPRLVFTPQNAVESATRYRTHPLYRVLETRARRAGAADSLSQAGSRELRDIAFVYRVSGEAALGQKGAGALDRAIDQVLAGRYRQEDDQAHSVILTNLAWAYDWLYDALPAEARRSGAEALVRLIRYGIDRFSFNFAPGRLAAFNNHSAQAIAANALAGLAAAGEHPDALPQAEWAYTQFLQVFFPVLRFVAGENGIWNEGTHYNMVMLKPLFYFMDGVRSATDEDLYAAEPWVRSTSLYWPYLTQPDGTMVMLGDWWYSPSTPNLYPNLHSRIFAPVAKAAQESRDPHLQAYARWLLPRVIDPQVEPWHVVWFDPDLPDRPLAELPPSRLFHGDPTHGGEELAVLRSGWGADARVITLAGGDWFSHHDHYNAGAFTIFYKGDLAIDPGYDGESLRDWQFFRRTIAHNTIVVDAPGAAGILAGHPWGFEGGQRVPILEDRPRNLEQYSRLRNPEYPEASLFETGGIIAFETSERFDYVAVDATRAYKKAQLSSFVRHLVFLKPDVVLVYDVVRTPDGQSPRWLLQSVQPARLGEREFLVENGDGALSAQVLLPEAPRIQGVPTPAGSRTEVAGQPGSEHRFVVVMHVTEKGGEAHPAARVERAGDALVVTIDEGGTAEKSVRVWLRWDGQPGVQIASEPGA